jgi:hypothetical protein
MGNYEQLKQAVSDVIKTNGNQEITGAILKNTLLTIISTVGNNATFAGIATPDTNPGTPDENIFYFATTKGQYVNFGGIEVNNEAVILQNKNNTWRKKTTGIALALNVDKLSRQLYFNDVYLANKKEFRNLFSYTPLEPTLVEENKLIRSNGELEEKDESLKNSYNVAYFDVLENNKYYISCPIGGQYANLMFLSFIDENGSIIFSECNAENTNTKEFVFTAKKSGKLRICYRNFDNLLVYKDVQINNKNFVWYDTQTEFDIYNIFGYKGRAYNSIVDIKFYNCDSNEKRALYIVRNGRKNDNTLNIRTSVLKNDVWEVEFEYKVNDVNIINPKGNAIFDVEIRNGIKKCIITFNSAYIDKIDGSQIVDNINANPLLIFSKNCYVENGLWYKEFGKVSFPIMGFVSSKNNEFVNQAGYHTSDFIEVKKWNIILSYLYGSVNVYAISLYDENKNFIKGFLPSSTIPQVMGTNYYIVKDDNVKFARATASDTVLDLSYLIISDRMPIEVFNFVKNDGNNLTKNYLLKKERHSVNFSFDDGHTNDTLIKSVFDKKEIKCGFAPIAANNRYIEYNKEGFEILAHGTTPLNNATEEQAKTAFIKGKSVVERMGIICNGWVTPSSQLKEDLHPLVYDYFNYGFTTYKGKTIKGQVQTQNLKSYDLWRISLATLKDNLTIIDEAVSLNGVVSVYAHGFEIDNLWTIQDLENVIDYIKARTEILIPYESYIKLYSIRHNEQ